MAEFDRRQGWGTWECRSCAHWLNWKCGLDLTTGRDHPRLPTTEPRAVVDQNCRLGLALDHHTAMPTWAGERLDLELCMDALLSSAQSGTTKCGTAPG